MNRITESYLKHWVAGLKLIGKLILFVIVLAIFSLPLNFLEEVVSEQKEQDTFRFVIVTGYWITIILVLPFIYGLVGRVTYLVSDESVGAESKKDDEDEIPCLNGNMEFDPNLPPRKL
ncbi:hypothetical protein [Pelagicoccus albus]|uniref:Uncharacterized protein n=1 Tax=Pelagicoccus albus TaxID=415222 RepID=A0A7X1B5B2_9BACT|nr:hypothetical protein [Pelagicoccus albus]MBC2604812.1 hypothetical protein [Pelagicoccus albus]MBC2604823.1 hypothetical protein [Pelagicoccus albus]MBC2604828.1 hypothetical protein [Pelagicoccus albus]